MFQEEVSSRIVEAQRLDSVLMAENALDDKLDGQTGACFLRSACSVGTVPEADIPE